MNSFPPFPFPAPDRDQATSRAGRPDADQRLARQLCDELRGRWDATGGPPAEELLARHPQLAARPELAAQVVGEEVRVRRQFGHDASAATFLARFPSLQPLLEILFFSETARPMPPPTDDEAPALPAVGERVGDYRLEAELGRGAAGAVFLARQRSLADRPVALKVVPRAEREHLCLARLQHTHIVPLLAADVDPPRRLRLVALPYFGGASLARVLGRLAAVPPADRTGRLLTEALAAVAGPPVDDQAPGPRAWCRLYDRLSYADAVCTVVACLADALAYAHRRRLCHLDVKPANVLLAGDGQPMLLDFHLAREPLPAGAAVDLLGGTLDTMAPEQQAAVQAVRQDRPVPQAVGPAADVYALGVTLYEALGGPLPFRPGDAAALRRVNRQVSVGLADLIGRATDPDPDRRMPADELADDLRRLVRGLPLQTVPNRSVRERWRRWRRRRPTALRSGLLALGFALSLFSVLTLVAIDYHRRTSAADRLLQEGVELHRTGRHDEALAELQRAREQVAHVPFSSGRVTQLDDAIGQVEQAQRRAERGRLAEQLHRLADRLRSGYAADGPVDVGPLAERARAVWDRREELYAGLDLEPGSIARDDLLDVAVLPLTAPPFPPTDEARRRLDELARRFGPSPVFVALRQRLLGEPAPSEEVAPAASARELRTLGQLRLHDGDARAAADLLERACRLAPGDRWAHALLGHALMRLGRPADAVACFSVCVGAAPDDPAAYLSRAAAYAALGQRDRARSDVDRVLALVPDQPEAVRLRRRLAR